MKFYDREKELAFLQNIQKQSVGLAQMTVITGRRRIGKTQLLLEATKNQPTLYFFVARKSEAVLCNDFQQEIEEKLGVQMFGKIERFALLFKYLMELSKTTSFNLIIDEFQEFFTVAPTVYSDMQHYWDINKDQSKINLLLSGSVYSLMHKIFQDHKEPLFGRATARIMVKPFTTDVLKQILQDYNPQYTNEDLLALYCFTGGVAKYVQLLMDSGSNTYEKMLDYIVSEDSLFISEGKNMLIDEFGKEYTNYFSILSSIARGENTRARIESAIGKEIGGYLTKLEDDYSLISKSMPIYSKPKNKNIRYTIGDNFLTFWFRFIYKYSHIIEIGAYKQLKEIIVRDYATFSQLILERYFRDKFIETQNYTRIAGYWDRKGENEIDLIALNEIKETATIAEIKRNKENFSQAKLIEKKNHLCTTIGEIKDYNINLLWLSLDDM